MQWKKHEYDTKDVMTILTVFPSYPLYRSVCKIESIIQIEPSLFHQRIQINYLGMENVQFLISRD